MITRFTKLGALVGALLIAGTSAATACYKFSNPEAAITVCGDPRAFILMDNTDARRMDATFRVVFWSGKTGERKVIRKTIDAGESKLIKRWVKGGKRGKVSVYDDRTNELMARVVVRDVLQPWSAEECQTVRQVYTG